MENQKIFGCIVDIGTQMIKTGAEPDRVEDSIYRMLNAYEFQNINVWVIPSNIQAYAELKDGTPMTQIRNITSSRFDYDKLDYLNNLSRYTCANKPEYRVLRLKYEEVMARPDQPIWLRFSAALLAAASFTIFFNGTFLDALSAATAAAVMTIVNNTVLKDENNPLIFNFASALVGTFVIVLLHMCGISVHPSASIIGIVMILIGSLGLTAGIQSLLRKYTLSGIIDVSNSILGATGIALGVVIPVYLVNMSITESPASHEIIVQLISCTLGCFAFVLMGNTKGKQIAWATLGAFLTWCVYLLVSINIVSGIFFPTLAGATFGAFYSYIMARVNKAPQTIFIGTTAYPLLPGSSLYYMMFGIATSDAALATESGRKLALTVTAIVLGYLLFDVVMKYIIKPILDRLKPNKATNK